MESLPVIFRKDSYGVTAVFPTLPWDRNGSLLTCYAHIGQHSGCSLEWYHSTKPATDEESAPLLRELTAIYTDRPAARPDIYGGPVKLQPVKRMTRAYRAAAAYECDRMQRPNYHDGKPRPAWGSLDKLAQSSWIKNPTPRDWQC